MRQPLREMGVIAAQTLLRRLNNHGHKDYPRTITVEPDLIVRASTTVAAEHRSKRSPEP